MSERIFIAPGAYVQGPGSLDLVGEKAALYGSRAFVVCDEGVRALVGTRLAASLAAAEVEADINGFAGEVTLEAIDALASVARDAAPFVIVGIGGGRAIDAAKGVARRLGLAVITVPTIASTDAPAARGIAVYDDDHRVVTVEQLPRNPDFVLVDTALIAAAPGRFLAAGIGDALSKKFEAEAMLAGCGVNKHGTRPLHTPLILARACHDLVLRDARAALRACDEGRPDAALERIVEAILLMSPMIFENTGLSIAHAMAPALAACPATAGMLHGEHAAYGTLVQIVAEGRAAAEIAQTIAFCRSVGLPVSLAELGLPNPAEADIATLAGSCAVSPLMKNQPNPLDRDDIARAMRWLEAAPYSPEPGA